jgi:hypothetical protein
MAQPSHPAWWEVIEELKREIPRASFVSIKLINSGTPDNSHQDFWFNRLANSLRVHRPVQLGICLFKSLVTGFKVRTDDETMTEDDAKWEARPYTLSLFCSNGCLAQNSGHFEWSKEQLMNLFSRGWDMDDWVDKGIPYLGKMDQDLMNKEKVVHAQRAKARLQAYEPPKNEFRTKSFLESLRSTIDDWLMNRIVGSFVIRDDHINCYGEDENTLIISAANGYFSFLTFWLVEREFGQVVIEWEKKKMRLKRIQHSKWIPPTITAISQGNKDVFSGNHQDLYYVDSMKQYDHSRSLIELLFNSKKTIVGFDMLVDVFQLNCSFINSHRSLNKDEGEDKLKMIAKFYLDGGMSLFDLGSQVELHDINIWRVYDAAIPLSPGIRLSEGYSKFSKQPEDFEAGYLALLIGQEYIERVLQTQQGFSNTNATSSSSVLASRDLNIKLSLLEMAMTHSEPSPPKASSKRKLVEESESETPTSGRQKRSRA